MSDSNLPISNRVEFLSLLPGYLNGSLGTADRHRMEDALQQHPEWQEDVAFDRLWKNAMHDQKPVLGDQEAWLIFREHLLKEDLIKRKWHTK